MGDLCDAGCRAADGVTRASHPAALHTIKAAVSPGHTAQLFPPWLRGARRCTAAAREMAPQHRRCSRGVTRSSRWAGSLRPPPQGSDSPSQTLSKAYCDCNLISGIVFFLLSWLYWGSYVYLNSLTVRFMRLARIQPVLILFCPQVSSSCGDQFQVMTVTVSMSGLVLVGSSSPRRFLCLGGGWFPCPDRCVQCAWCGAAVE